MNWILNHPLLNALPWVLLAVGLWWYEPIALIGLLVFQLAHFYRFHRGMSTIVLLTLLALFYAEYLVPTPVLLAGVLGLVLHVGAGAFYWFWERVREVAPSASICTDEGFVLGQDAISQQPVKITEADTRLHAFITGTTGSGKTTTIKHFVHHALSTNMPVFYIDGKGDLSLAREMARLAKQKSVPFYLFSMVGESMSYNPLSFGGFTSIKDRIIALRHWSEDHYRKIAEGYLQTVLKIMNRVGAPLNLHTLASYLDVDELYLQARKLKDKSLFDEIDAIAPRRRDISSLLAEIENLVKSEIGHLFDCQQPNPLTLKEVFEQRGFAYFCLQPLAFPSYAQTLGKLIINDLKSLLAAQLDEASPTPHFAIFDEFSVFAGEQVVNIVNQGRAAGAHVVLATQSLSDLKQGGGTPLVGQVINNCNLYIIQRQNDPSDAEYLAKVIGQGLQYKVGIQMSSEADKISTHLQPSWDYVIRPNEIQSLAQGEAILLNKQTMRHQKISIALPEAS